MIFFMAAKCRRQLWLLIWQSGLYMWMLTVMACSLMRLNGISSQSSLHSSHWCHCYLDASSPKAWLFPPSETGHNVKGQMFLNPKLTVVKTPFLDVQWQLLRVILHSSISALHLVNLKRKHAWPLLWFWQEVHTTHRNPYPGLTTQPSQNSQASLLPCSLKPL